MDLQKVMDAFGIPGRIIACRELMAGNINRTYEIECELADGSIGACEKYIFQRINTYVFRHPREVMSNILNVTEHIKQKLLKSHGSYDRRVLSYVTTDAGVPYVDAGEEGFWRAYTFVDNAKAYDIISDPYYFYEAGRAFGEFQGQLADFPATTLFETIPDFHNTAKRLQALEASSAADTAGRRKSVEREIRFLLDRRQEGCTIVDLLEKGEIPYRVTHNDTKINNILFDTQTDKAICVIDLDTVMPGASLYDFGDAVRSGASTAAEDERDLSKVSFDLGLFEQFTKGFIEQTAGLLTPREIELLPLGGKILTLELAARFLTDYLDGDVYFKTTRPGQNLDRARTQIRLVEDIEAKFGRMNAIVDRYKGCAAEGCRCVG